MMYNEAKVIPVHVRRARPRNRNVMPHYYSAVVRLHQIVRDAADDIADGSNYYDSNPDLIELLGRLGMPIRKSPHLDHHAAAEEMVEVVAGVLINILWENRGDARLPQLIMENLTGMLDEVGKGIAREVFSANYC